MTREHRTGRNRSSAWRVRLNHAVAAVIVTSLASPVVAWGVSPPQQWGGEQQGLIFTGLKMVGALALILGLILLSLHFLKRYRAGVSRRPPESQVHILDVRMLAPKKSIALVEVAGERLLLGVGTETVTMLSRIDSRPQQVSAAEKEGGPGFAKTLLHSLRRRSQEGGNPVPTSANPVQSHAGLVERSEHSDAESRGHGDAETMQLTMLK